MKWLKQHIGELTIGLGIIHIGWGITEYRDVITDLAQNGWWKSLDSDKKAERGEFFWFMIGGVSSISEGILIRSLLKNGVKIPRAYGLANLGVMSAIGSGFKDSGAPAGLALAALVLTGSEPKQTK